MEQHGIQTCAASRASLHGQSLANDDADKRFYLILWFHGENRNSIELAAIGLVSRRKFPALYTSSQNLHLAKEFVAITVKDVGSQGLERCKRRGRQTIQ
jgi:hypothetical protein